MVHIACGLDSSIDRLDNDRVEWYDLDLPDVIALRRKFIGDEEKRYRLLGGMGFSKRRHWRNQRQARRAITPRSAAR